MRADPAVPGADEDGLPKSLTRILIAVSKEDGDSGIRCKLTLVRMVTTFECIKKQSPERAKIVEKHTLKNERITRIAKIAKIDHLQI